MKYYLSVFFVVVGVIMASNWQGCMAAFSANYSLSASFPNGIHVPQFQSSLEKVIWGNTFLGIVVTGDVVEVQFVDPVVRGVKIVLDAYVGGYTGASLLQDFCADLPDANVNITEAMVKLGVIVTNCTADRTYTLMTATEMVVSGRYRGKFVLVNNGVGIATIGIGTGGSTPNNMTVAAGTATKFRYGVTNDITGSHAYLVLRTSK